PGDIERPVEHLLLAKGLAGPLSVLLTPHHGSNSSSSPAFVTTIQPGLVLHSSGYLNHFGHPSPAVQSRYTRHASRQLNTAHSGAIQLTLTPTGISQLTEHRATRKRFWAYPKQQDTDLQTLL